MSLRINICPHQFYITMQTVKIISFSHPHVSVWAKKYTIAEDYQIFFTKATPSMSVGSRTKSLIICKYTTIKHLLDVVRAQRIKKTSTIPP